MFKVKPICSFLAVFLFVLFAAGVSGTGLTIEEASSCSGCTAASTGKWCTGVFQGCSKTGSCPTGSTEQNCAQAGTNLSANCKGCTEANKTWCVVNDGDVQVNKCIEKVSDLRRGHRDCLNGELYDNCQGLDSAVLVPKPLIQNCDDCGSPNSWCTATSSTATGETQTCIVNGACKVGTTTAACSSTDTSQKKLKHYTFPKNCKACLLIGDHSWCSESDIVGFAACIKTSDWSTKCPGVTLTASCKKPEETTQTGNGLSDTCTFCRAGERKWCASADARKCVAGNASCPTNLNWDQSCSNPNTEHTYYPEISRNLPKKCSECIVRNKWCVKSGEVKTCLPSAGFDFYCRGGDATCSPTNEDIEFDSNPLYLPPKCDDCVKNGDNKWCITELNTQKYQFCVPKDEFCFGANRKLVLNCNDLKAEEKNVLIPISGAKNCNECIGKKNDWKWVVHSRFGEKLRICMPTDAADTLCVAARDCVAFHHCRIAPEDQGRALGLFKLFDGSPAFASLSLMTIVVALGFNFL